MMLKSAVANIILFPNILGLIMSAVAVIVGFILSFIINKLLPQPLFSLLGVGFFYDLPQYLQVVGSVGFVVTFFGSTGAFLDGRVGKCLLVMYVVTLTVAVSIEIFMLSTLYMGHRGLGVQAPVASPLTADLRHYDPRETKEENYFNENNPRIINSNEENDDGNTHLRNRRAVPSFSSISNTFKGATDSIKQTVGSKAKIMKDKAALVIDTVQDEVGAVRDKARSGAEMVKSGATQFMSGMGLLTKLGLKLGDTANFLIGIFASLTPEEEERVKIIKPFLGKLTGPAFRLIKSKYIMIACVSAIILEIFFVLSGLYLFTTKDEGIE